jgi:hypothetical protein
VAVLGSVDDMNYAGLVVLEVVVGDVSCQRPYSGLYGKSGKTLGSCRFLELNTAHRTYCPGLRLRSS